METRLSSLEVEQKQQNNECQSQDKELTAKYNDLMVKYNQLKDEDNSLSVKYNNLMVYYNELMAKDQELVAQDNEFMLEFNNSMAKDDELMDKYKQMSDVLDEVKKMETGTLDCGNSDHGWTNDARWKHKDITVHFSKTYRNSPSVEISFMYIDNEIDNKNTDKDDEFGVYLGSVTLSYFTLRCWTYHTKQIQEMKVGWVSLPKF